VELTDKVTQLEDEVKILKNEIQAILLDLRESYLNSENPISRELPPFPEQHIVVSAPQGAAPQQSSPPQPQATADALPEDSPAGQPESRPSGRAEPTDASEPARETAPAEVPEPLYEPRPTSEREPVQEPARKPPRFEPEPIAESAPVFEPASVATDERAREEVTRAWRPMAETEVHAAAFAGNGGHSGGHDGGHSRQIDLATISSLADWVLGVVKRLGSERAESILDISEMVGFIEPELKGVLIKFIHPDPGENEGKVMTRDYLTSLRELDGILGKATKFEIALLSILCQGNDSG
jgi:hypothetical protein